MLDNRREEPAALRVGCHLTDAEPLQSHRRDRQRALRNYFQQIVSQLAADARLGYFEANAGRVFCSKIIIANLVNQIYGSICMIGEVYNTHLTCQQFRDYISRLYGLIATWELCLLCLVMCHNMLPLPIRRIVNNIFQSVEIKSEHIFVCVKNSI